MKFIDRETGQVQEEIVYGKKAIDLLYGPSWMGKLLSHLASRLPFVSSFYGWLQKQPFSKRKIQSFIELFNINMNEYVNDYRTFNDFFIRKLKPEARPIAAGQRIAVCPADGRYRFFPNISASEGFVVKGEKFDLGKLLSDPQLAQKYEHGSMVIARLCPSDYHRFHFPIDNVPSQTKLINGWLYSVNPAALARDIHIFTKNKRALTQLESPVFGKVLYLEIGATNVGSIHQTFTPGQKISKGTEKGYFEFGASALIILFEKDKIDFDPDLLELQKQALFTSSVKISTEREGSDFAICDESIAKSYGRGEKRERWSLTAGRKLTQDVNAAQKLGLEIKCLMGQSLGKNYENF